MPGSRMPNRVDDDLNALISAVYGLDPQGLRTAGVLRSTFDQLYAGQRTGRYRWDQLHRIERTNCGRLIEINLHREFRFEDGEKSNFKICGIDLFFRYSEKLLQWIVPSEAIGSFCLLLLSEDALSQWSLGLIRITAERLNTGGNQDRKATLNQQGRAAIIWLFHHAPLPPNVLLQLDET